MYSLIRRLLFLMDAESTHNTAHHLLGVVGRSPLLRRAWKNHVTGETPQLATRVFDLQVKNPVGLAAGFDKNARIVHALTAFGFGWIELGTVTPRPQPGNDRPRLFRLPKHQAIINRNGFNNCGLTEFCENVRRFRSDQSAGNIPGTVLGINIGKNTATSVADAEADYIRCLTAAYPLADYVAVNISSPNSPGLRELQHVDALAQLLSALKEQQLKLSGEHGVYRPLVVKLAPDLTDSDVRGIATVISNSGIDGVIATNTTIERRMLGQERFAQEAGGLSGQPLAELSEAICQQLRDALPSRIPLVACGGIDNAQSVRQRLNAGCVATQLYTGLIYRGPSLIGKIVRELNASA